MSVEALLRRLASLQIELWLEDDARLRFRAPQGVLDEALRAAIKEQRETLITHLRQALAPGPLTLGQQALIFYHQLWPDSSTYNVSLTLRLRGPLVVTSLAAALADLAVRHPLLAARLRTTATRDELYRDTTLLLQPITPALSLEQIRIHAHDSAQVPFRLYEEPLARAALYFCTDGDAIFHLCCHHLIVDGTSFAIIRRDLALLYAHHRAGTAPPGSLRHSFTEFVHWQNTFLNSAEAVTQRRYWLAQLAGELPTPELPWDHRRRATTHQQGDEVPVVITPKLSDKLRALAIDLGITPSAVFLAALAVLCARYGDQDELLIGVPYNGRRETRFAEVVGYFVNTLPLRLRCDLRRTFAELAVDAAKQLSDSVAHGDYPLARLVEDLARPRDPYAPPLYQIGFGFHSHGTPEMIQTGDDTAALPFADLLSIPFVLTQQNSQNALGITIFDLGTALAGKLSYSTQRFTRPTAQRIAGHFVQLLGAAVAAPKLPCVQLPLLAPAEHQTVVVAWNQTAYPSPDPGWLTQQLSLQATTRPDAVALRSEIGDLTYAELERRSNQLAHHLRKRGVGPDVLVGVYLPRQIELVVAICAVLKAGGAYLPLDPELPAERLRWQLEDSAVPLVLVLQAQRLPIAVPVLVIDAVDLETEPTTPPAVPIAAHHLAYAIFTSGSTGRPKAALIEHGSLQNQLLWLLRTYEYGAQDVTLQRTPASFDASVWELLVPLLGGAPLVLARPGGHRDPHYLIDLIEQYAVRVVQLVPSLLRALLTALTPGRCSSLRRVFCGGEALDVKLARICREKLPQAELINLYGPTECTINATSWRYSHQAAVIPIGRPVDNTQAYVLDALGQPTPIGVAGELYLGGAQVARGYLNRPELTAARFVHDPFSTDKTARLYRTGDKARWLADGTLEYLGRLDTQVKLRGHRIELGEIESVLRTQPGVQDCAVVVHALEDTDERLVAYIQTDAPLVWQDLRAALQQCLPEVMIPALWMPIPALPKTPSGKLARNQLPPPNFHSEITAPAALPQTPIEDTLTAIFSAVLKREGLDAGAHFFALGGHSLLALQVMVRIHEQLGVQLPLRALFDAPTVRQLAQQIAAQPVVTTSPLPARDGRADDQSMPLSPSQRFLWQYESRSPGSSYNNVADAMWLYGQLDLAALQQALDQLLIRHEMLRVHITQQDGALTQRAVPPMPWPLTYTDLRVAGPEQRLDTTHEHALRLANHDARQPFVLTAPPLARAAVYKTAAAEHLVLLVFHHIVTDGWSLTIVWRDLMALYIAETTATPAALPPLRAGYADYLRELPTLLTHERLTAGITTFRKRLATLPMLQLPTDYPRPAVRRFRGDFCEIAIDTELRHSLTELALACGATCYMVLLTAVAIQLAVWSGQRAFRLGIPVAARLRPEYEALVGCFTNTIILGIDLRDELSFATALSRVRETVMEALVHELTPLGELIPLVESPPPAGYAVGFQALVTHRVLSYPQLPALRMTPATVWAGITKRDLHLHIVEQPDRIWCGLIFDSDLFATTTIAAFVADYLAQLRRVVADPNVAISALGVRPT